MQALLVGDGVEGRHGDRAVALSLEPQGQAAPNHLGFVDGRGVRQAVTQHEAVELRLGELEGAGLLDGVLRGDDEEGGGQVVRGVADRHATLLHGLEQGRLHLRAGAVDLVGQQQVREDGPLVHAELAGALLEDLRAHDVGGEQVDRELHAAELEVDGLGHRLHEQRLGDARHALEQQVAAREQRDQHPLHHAALAHDGPGHVGPHGLGEGVGIGRGRGRLGQADRRRQGRGSLGGGG